MVNQAFRIKIAYRSKEKEKGEKKENTRDRSVPDGSDNNLLIEIIRKSFSYPLPHFISEANLLCVKDQIVERSHFPDHFLHSIFYALEVKLFDILHSRKHVN